MNDLDLNLLIALDALLSEASVTAAARRLGLSSSAMSRTLSRLRTVTGDALLVRAGNGLVMTPRATQMRSAVHALVRDAHVLMRPAAAELDVATLDRTFRIRANEGFVELFAGRLAHAVLAAAPQVCLNFVPKPDHDPLPLRDGTIDLEIGLAGLSGPEVVGAMLFRDRFVGVVRAGHPLLSGGPLTLERYAAAAHVVASRRATVRGPVDIALEEAGFQRSIRVVVPGFPDAMSVARQTDLVALVTQACFEQAPAGLCSFELPVETPSITVSAMWHPRMNSDAAHAWLRKTVVSVCRSALPLA